MYSSVKARHPGSNYSIYLQGGRKWKNGSLKRNLQLAPLALLSMIVLVGCGSSHYAVLEPASESVTDFSILEIRNFSTTLSDRDSVNLANRFADQLYKTVMEERKAHPDESVFEHVVRATDQTDDVLVLDGTLISFEKGSRFDRWMWGFGTGKAYCTIRTTFSNKRTGNVVLKVDFDGELSMGFFGGDAEEAVDRVVEAFISYFDDYFEKEGIVSS